MTAIYQSGGTNPLGPYVPGLSIGIAKPSTVALTGVDTGRVGVVGTASWGQVGNPIPLGGTSDFVAAFGPYTARTYDMGTQVAVLAGEGVSDLIGVRVSDGTDTAASFGIATATGQALGVAALNTGIVGNNITIAISAGSITGWRCTLTCPLLGITEIFDNISAATVPATWVAIAAAINSGQGVARGPSVLVSAAGGASTTAIAAASYTLSGGTDGAGVTAAQVVGVDGLTPSGMYVLRKQSCAMGLLADVTDSTQWGTIGAFGQAAGIYMHVNGPSGDNIANAVAVKNNLGISNYALKINFGDWIWWYDQTNQLNRLIGPAAFACAQNATIGPQNSTLNKQFSTIIGSQKAGLASTGQSLAYSNTQLSELFAASIDVIGNPSPGGSYWSCLLGHNSSTDARVYGDNYSKMTNFVAETLATGMGLYVGQTITLSMLTSISSSILGFLGAMLTAGQLGSLDGSLPYGVVCDLTNNSVTSLGLGNVQCDVQVRYLGINEKFNISLLGGTTVVVSIGQSGS